MRIQSNFKDYYDYVEYLSSPEGGDPNVLYRRTRLGDPKESGYGTEKSSYEVGRVLPITPEPLPKWVDSEKGFDHKDVFPWRFKWCIVCDKFYLLAAKEKPADNYDPNYYEGYKNFKLATESHPIWEYTSYPGHHLFIDGGLTKRHKVSWEKFVGIKSEGAVKLCKEFNSPAILVEPSAYSSIFTGYYARVSRILPNLGALGFASIIPADRMYQEIAMFVGNTLRESPDLNPPAKVSDKERLLQRGFDLKTSFRGKPST